MSRARPTLPLDYPCTSPKLAPAHSRSNASNSPSSRSKASSYMLAEYLLSPSTLTERLANNISPDSVNKANGKMADRLKELNYSMGKQIQVAKSDTAKQDMLETELQSMLKEIISHQK